MSSSRDVTNIPAAPTEAPFLLQVSVKNCKKKCNTRLLTLFSLGVIIAGDILGGIKSSPQVQIDVNHVNDSVSDPTSLTTLQTDFFNYVF